MDALIIAKKEWFNFTGSEKGVFVVYGILIFVWSFLPLYNDLGSFAMSGAVWWLFFSVIVSGNFANSVFVAERMSGSMEILLTCGFSRNGVLYGKLLFVMLMSTIIGAICFGLSIIWVYLSGKAAMLMGPSLLFAGILFVSGTFMNATIGAWMSIRLSSPRLIPFVNIMLVGAVCSTYYALHFAIDMSEWMLAVILLCIGTICLFFAKKDFHSEKIIAPIDM